MGPRRPATGVKSGPGSKSHKESRRGSLQGVPADPHKESKLSLRSEIKEKLKGNN